MSSDLWVITSYFNPARYTTKRRNFDAFMAGMKEVGANVLVIEMAFGETPFELEPSDGVIQFRGSGVMWQKERLLNVAAARLPPSCRKIAWVDADIIFEETDWIERTSEALESYAVVQPFSQALRLNRENRDDEGAGFYESFASVFVRNPSMAKTSRHHGHTGFAWSARRELFERCGLYDACISGGGDHLMAHAFAASIASSPCVHYTFGGADRYAEHFVRWGKAARDLVGGRIGVVAGQIRHLWHGELAERSYHTRERHFRTLGFDPDAHLKHDENGMFEWSAEAPAELRAWAQNLFASRNEDGEQVRGR